VQPRDLDGASHAQLRVEVRERLVEQEHLGLAHDGAPDRDALALAARQRPACAQQARQPSESARRRFTRFSISARELRELRSPNAMLSKTFMCG
jgi:hypothetical protein